MTQPLSPFGTPQAPTRQAGLFGVPVAAPRPTPEQAAQAQHAEIGEQSNQEEDNAKEEAYRAALRQEIGAADTIGVQAARGALDALLAPGALVGLYAQGVGETLGSESLTRFGRDLGRASSGKSAAEALGYVLGGGDTERADRARIQIEKQEQAHPTLAMISKLAGTTAFGLGLGVGSTASKAGATIAANALEGAAGGAQIAYEQKDDAPLRDVMTSAAIGAVLGGGLAAAGEGVAAGVRKVGEKVARGDLDKVFGQIQQFADNRMVDSAIGNNKKLRRILTDNGRDNARVARVAQKMRDADMPLNADAMLGVAERKADDAFGELTRIGAELDGAGIKPSAVDLFGDVYDQARRIATDGTATHQGIANRIMGEIAPFREQLAVKQLDQFGNEVVVGYRDPTFTQLRRWKQSVGDLVDFSKKTPTDADEAIADLYGNFARKLDAAADAAGPQHGAAWRRANQDASDWIVVRNGLREELERRVTSRFISPSDYGVGLAGFLGTIVSSANPIGAVAAGAAAAVGHRALRFAGSKMASGLANRLARTRFHVPITKAGGSEAQQVLQQVGRARKFMQETAESAGQNPTVRETASNAAREVAADAMAKAAGEFDPAAWSKVSPVGKVVHRSEILDAASNDLSAATAQALSLRAPIPEAIDPGRLARMTRDANGPEAIGGMQRAVADLIAAVPPTAGGSAAGRALRIAADELSRSNVAESFGIGHRLAVQLEQAGQAAAAGAPDVANQAGGDFATRSALALRDALSSDAFGEAGRRYRQLVATPNEAEAILSDPAKLRAALVELQGPGVVSAAAQVLAKQIDDSHAAAALFSGARKSGMSKELAALVRLAEDAENATLVDGKPVAKLLELADEGPKAINPETEVLETVGAEVDKIAPVLKPGALRRSGRAVPGTLRSPERRTVEEQQRLYQQRTDALVAAVSQPDPERLNGLRGGPEVATAMGGKLQQLLADLPKPAVTIRGKQQLSSDDLRRANAMWEATLEPLSVFQDFARGAVDPDKAQYAWKQYPGLQQACQAGVLDVITNDLDDKERATIPDPILSQLDFLLGFGGKLQPNVDPAFALRMSSLPVTEQSDQPRPNAMVELPGSEPTHTEQMARTL